MQPPQPTLPKRPIAILLMGLALSMACTLLAASHSYAAETAKTPMVKIIPAPAGCLAPDVFMDAKGCLHMVYGLDHHAYYVRSLDNGAHFTDPVKVDSSGKVETKMGERGPKLAVGKDGSVHVVWVDEWAPGVKTFVRYSRSLDAGKSFEPLKSVSTMSGVDGATLAADANGNVVAFWHVMADPKPGIKEATWLHTSRSKDNGATFSPSEKLNIANHNGLACSMCMMRARADANGMVSIAFRSAEDSIRDFYVLRGRIQENRFSTVRVNEDNWKIDYCPMCGPELNFAANGQSLCAFMVRKKVYWAISDSNMKRFNLHVGTPGSEEDEIYPSAIANKKGDVLLVWQVGPMAVQGTAIVKWARYDKAGKPTGESGVIGKSFAGTKATSFVGTDENFYVVTTAVAEKSP